MRRDLAPGIWPPFFPPWEQAGAGNPGSRLNWARRSKPCGQKCVLDVLERLALSPPFRHAEITVVIFEFISVFFLGIA